MIEIDLENSKAQYRIGAEIVGSVRWSGLSESASSLEIRLVWYTSGKGDRDLEVVQTRSVDNLGLQGESQFAFTTPLSPYSFSGQLISLIWTIEVEVSPGGESESKKIVIGPEGKEVLLYVSGGTT